MDVIFLRSKELNWEENYERASSILGRDLTIIDGSNAKSLKHAYDLVLDAAKSEHFMMIEADNYIYDVVTKYLDVQEPMKFWTTNRYGIQYEHGGIKIMNVDACRRQLKTNANIYENFEISANLFLKSNHDVLSEHRFDFSPKNEWVTIAKELIKLYYWGHDDYLDRWLVHDRPAQIFADTQQILQGVGFTRLFENLLPSLGKIYEDQFAK